MTSEKWSNKDNCVQVTNPYRPTFAPRLQNTQNVKIGVTKWLYDRARTICLIEWDKEEKFEKISRTLMKNGYLEKTLHHDSNHPQNVKIEVAKCRYDRLRTIYLIECVRDEKFEQIPRILKKNGYLAET